MCVYLNTKEVFIVIPDDYKPEEFEGSPNQTCIGWMFMKNDRHQSFVVIKVFFFPTVPRFSFFQKESRECKSKRRHHKCVIDYC